VVWPRRWAGGRPAVATLTVALKNLPPEYKHERIWYDAWLARAHAQAGGADRAADVAVRLAEPSADSARARMGLARVAQLLAEAGAARQAQAIRDALAAHPAA
jgi:hypothetical protein